MKSSVEAAQRVKDETILVFQRRSLRLHDASVEEANGLTEEELKNLKASVLPAIDAEIRCIRENVTLSEIYIKPGKIETIKNSAVSGLNHLKTGAIYLSAGIVLAGSGFFMANSPDKGINLGVDAVHKITGELKKLDDKITPRLPQKPYKPQV